MMTDDLDLAAPPEDDLAPPPDDGMDGPPPEEDPVAGEMARVAFGPMAAMEAAIAANESLDDGPPAALVELLPDGFPLPALIKFEPDPRLRQAADTDAEKLLAIDVTDETTMRVMDACLERQRAHKKTIEGLFEEPTAIAYQLHKRLTVLRGEWLEQSERAIRVGGQRVVETQRRLDQAVAEERRRRQAEADRQAREQAAREAAAAAAANAPAEVVEQLQEEAKTATAPPLPLYEPTKGALKSTSVVSTWKPRLKGTDGSAAVQQPAINNLTPAQKVAVLAAMRAVMEGRAPLQIFDVNWTYLNQRARADKKAFAIEGFEVYEDGSTRGKGTRRS